jgi:hypothetical protein
MAYVTIGARLICHGMDVHCSDGAGATESIGLTLLAVVPLLPVMLAIDRYVRRSRNGMPPANGPEVSP